MDKNQDTLSWLHLELSIYPKMGLTIYVVFFTLSFFHLTPETWFAKSLKTIHGILLVLRY